MNEDDPRAEDDFAEGYDEAEAWRDQERERAPAVVRAAEQAKQLAWW